MRVTVSLVIIDDNDLFLSAVSKLLAGEGMAIVGVATTADAGVELVASKRPDLVLVDVQLGADDGFDVARRIAALPDRPPVVMTSSRAEADLGDLAEGSHAIGFVTKSCLSAGALDECYRRSR